MFEDAPINVLPRDVVVDGAGAGVCVGGGGRGEGGGAGVQD